MNFFANQERARKQISKLVAMYLLTVIFVSLATGAVIAIITLSYLVQEQQFGSLFEVIDQLKLHPMFWRTIAFCSFTVAVVVLLASGFKMMLLGTPGPKIAKMVGAIPLEEFPQSVGTHRLRNVVEEMSLASGTAVPKIYIMPEDLSINAFVAGIDINSTILAVTRGTLEKLDRDELQGVIAHEYSHIFNGDMLLNVRLIGLLGGLTFIFQVGRVILRSQRHSGSVQSRSSGKNKGGGGFAMIGLALCVIGGLGVFLASWIKSKISQEKEFLADASSVQYTRNPEGILGALKKIYAYYEHSVVKAARASEAAHFFFADPVTSSFFQFATHPPLEKRLKAIDSRFNEKNFELNEVPVLKQKMEQLQSELSQTDFLSNPSRATEIKPTPLAFTAASVASVATAAEPKIESAFTKKQDHREYKILEAKVQAASLLLWKDESYNSSRSWLAQNHSPEFARLVDEKRELLKNKTQENGNAMELIDHLDVFAPKLFSLQREQGKELVMFLEELRLADGKTHLEEYLTSRFCQEVVRKESPYVSKRLKLIELNTEIGHVLSFLAKVCPGQNRCGSKAFEQALQKRSDIAEKLQLTYSEHLTYGVLDKCFDRLRYLAPLEKEKFLQLSIEVLNYDGKISKTEISWLKLLGQVLAIPSQVILEKIAIS